ncbi:hypothetical protein Tco_0575861, partial [Tanacetum coccineum]
TPDDEEDTRSSHKYLNDLEEEYQARALLAKSKRFFKKGYSKTLVPSYQSPFQSKSLSSPQHKPELRHTKDFEAKYNKVKAKLALLSSSASASKASTVKNKGLIAESYEWDEEEVSSDDNEMVELEEEKARRRGQVFNWQTATFGKIRIDDDLHDLSSVEAEFPAIVINDAFIPHDALRCKSQVSTPFNDEIDFRISFDEFDDEDYTIICDKNSFSYKMIYVDNLKTDSKNDNDKVNMPLLPSPKPTVSYFDDLDFYKDFENEFPAIVYNDAQTSKSDLLTEPILNPQHIDEFNLKDETSLSECDEEEQNVLNFNDLFPFNVIYPDELKTKTENDNDKVDIEHSSGDLSVKPLPDVINTDVGAYAHGSNKLLETIKKDACIFSSSSITPSVLSKEDLKGTRIEHGFKRAFMSLFGQDVDTFTSIMLLNVDQLQKQLDKDEFQEDGSMAAFWVVNNQFQKFIDSQFTLDYDSQMTDKYFVKYTGIEVKHFKDTLLQHMGNVKKSVAERTQSSGTKSEVQDDSSRSGNDTDADDADIRPIYDEEPMVEEVNSRAKIQSYKTRNSKQTRRSKESYSETWWIPTGKLFDSCTSKVDSEPTHGSNVDIPNIHKSKQTLDLNAVEFYEYLSDPDTKRKARDSFGSYSRS